MSCVQVFVPPLLWTLRRIQTNRLDLTEQYEFRQNVISSQVFCLTSADNKKPPPMSRVHTHTGWDDPVATPVTRPCQGLVSKHQIIIGFPSAALCSNPLNDKIVLLMRCTPHFTGPSGWPTQRSSLAVAIKHFQPGAWEGARVWERAVNCEPRWLLTWLHFSNCSRVLSSFSLFLWPLSHCYKWAGRGRGWARPTHWSSRDLEMGITRD